MDVWLFRLTKLTRSELRVFCERAEEPMFQNNSTQFELTRHHFLIYQFHLYSEDDRKWARMPVTTLMWLLSSYPPHSSRICITLYLIRMPLTYSRQFSSSLQHTDHPPPHFSLCHWDHNQCFHLSLLIFILDYCNLHASVTTLTR